MTTPGYYLRATDGEDVLLPHTYITKSMKVGDKLRVFLYNDSEDRLVATTLHPKAVYAQFAFMKVVDTTKIGAYVDWGLPKDILLC